MKNLRKKFILDEFNIDLSKLGINFGVDNPATYQDLKTIQVKRIDPELFDFIPRENDWDGSMGCSFDYHTIFADFGKGYEKLDVKPSGQSGSNYAHSTSSEYEGETIFEYFIRNAELRTPRTILLFYRSKSDWGQGSDHNTLELTIYKKAKDEDLIINLIDKKYDIIARQVVKEISF